MARVGLFKDEISAAGAAHAIACTARLAKLEMDRQRGEDVGIETMAANGRVDKRSCAMRAATLALRHTMEDDTTMEILLRGSGLEELCPSSGGSVYAMIHHAHLFSRAFANQPGLSSLFMSHAPHMVMIILHIAARTVVQVEAVREKRKKQLKRNQNTRSREVTSTAHVPGPPVDMSMPASLEAFDHTAASQLLQNLESAGWDGSM